MHRNDMKMFKSNCVPSILLFFRPKRKYCTRKWIAPRIAHSADIKSISAYTCYEYDRNEKAHKKMWRNKYAKYHFSFHCFRKSIHYSLVQSQDRRCRVKELTIQASRVRLDHPICRMRLKVIIPLVSFGSSVSQLASLFNSRHHDFARSICVLENPRVWFDHENSSLYKKCFHVRIILKLWKFTWLNISIYLQYLEFGQRCCFRISRWKWHPKRREIYSWTTIWNASIKIQRERFNLWWQTQLQVFWSFFFNA